MEALLHSFDSAADAFEWLGGATMDKVLAREASLLAREGPRHSPPHHSSLHSSIHSFPQPKHAPQPSTPHYLVFDVETDGGAGAQLAIQLAFIVYSKTHEVLHECDRLLQLPAGRRVNPYAQRVHGISDRTLHARAVDPRPVLDEFFAWADRVRAAKGRMVAHNAAFDAAVLTSTAAQNDLARSLAATDCFCTMRASTSRAGLVNRRGGAKPPKNSELYRLLHGADPDWAQLHNALDDVRVTACSYRAAAALGWWAL